MAGVSAGETLTRHGIDDFKIVEYQDRIGGRTLHTDFGVKPDGSPYTIELGTNWVRQPYLSFEEKCLDASRSSH